MNLNEIFVSKTLKKLLATIVCLVLALLLFQAGIYIGYRKAQISYQWGENYHRVFGGPRGGFLQDISGDDFMPGHGLAGTVMKVDGANLVIKSTDDVERVVTLTDDTTIRRGTKNISASDIKANATVTVICVPNPDGTMQAEFVRVFDPNSEPVPARPLFLRFPIPNF
ncbi:MAG: hypothetical protein M1275_00020 [Patescibacteria group bacterium]|nr:hypothetical protein [Patescibacteria group bacterium]